MIPKMERESKAGHRWAMRKEVEEAYAYFARVAELACSGCRGVIGKGAVACLTGMSRYRCSSHTNISVTCI